MNTEVNVQAEEKKVIVETKMPDWLRFFNVVFGLILFIASFILISFPQVQVHIVLGFAILVGLIGISRIANGLFDKGLRTSLKILKIVIGFILTGLGVLIYFAPTFGEDFFVIFTSSAIILNALTRITIIIMRKKLPDAVKILTGTLALLMLALAIIVLLAQLINILPALTEDLLIGLLAMTVQFSGIGRMISGVSGFRLTTTKTEEEYQRNKKSRKRERRNSSKRENYAKHKEKQSSNLIPSYFFLFKITQNLIDSKLCLKVYFQEGRHYKKVGY